MPHEIFEHTADLGLRVTAATLEAVFVEAAEGLVEVLTGGRATGRPLVTRVVDVPGHDPAELLADWLGEVLFLFEVEHLLPCGFSVTRRDDGIHGVIHGEPFDPVRHELAHEIKAVTRHLLDVRQAGNGWIATVVVDI